MPTAWLPPYEAGLLPYFLLYSTLATLAHALTTYLHPLRSIHAFSGPSAPPKSPLLAHVYGLINLLAASIRLSAAYHIHNAPVYDLAVLSFVFVLALYLSEILVWGTVAVRDGMVPIVASGVGVLWMVGGREWYLGY
ncbi:Erg28 family protein [Aspergillus homomorphus CBS 101889]|uniref:Ergosterol biosynthesis protein Erg28 n=1 Tax=Aspergillus homomorphus (strain CBS 101889) TaxID=1450537 RepID=A0A395HHP7_ASPHC|nr:hypothetical protein BO97DRAFT_481555 [Aspergillus homomorphus CBS 101889]RAL07019.1 hypothetical protein BO97DRAFT_481555 [Aspergillus homomorphus CBS 101889]